MNFPFESREPCGDIFARTPARRSPEGSRPASRPVCERESFVFETVFSDPAGDKLAFLVNAVGQGYTVALCFVGLEDAALSETRVAMRVLKGGHDVPTRKIKERFPRTLTNLRRAIRALPHVLVFDNSDLSRPFRAIATFRDGAVVEAPSPVPRWARGPVKPQ